MRSRVDIPALILESKLPEYWEDGSGVLMCMRQNQGVPDWFKKMPTLCAAIREIAQDQRVTGVMINIIPPGVSAPFHWDNMPPGTRRWHLPLQTNPGCGFVIKEDVPLIMPQGIWYGPFPYLERHAVWNFGTEERIHLVVDVI